MPQVEPAGLGEPPHQRVHASPPEHSSFDAFFRAFYKDLVKHALHVGAGSLAQAQDAASDAMEQVFREWPLAANPLAWAKLATRNHLINVRKRESRGAELIAQVARQERIDESQSDPSLNVWEDAQWVRHLLAQLPPEQGRIMAYIVDQHTPAEVAVLLGKTPEAVRVNLLRARKALRAELELRKDRITFRGRRSDD